MLNKNSVGLFFDSELDRKMVKDGYLILPFLNQEEVEFFKRLYKKWHPKDPDEFYKSYFDARIEYKKEVEDSITEIFDRKMKSVFKNYNAFGGLFVVKPPTEKGHLPPHQDWSFVDEKIDWSINMWCPLENVDDNNGNLVVLKGSHQFYETIRGSGTPDIYREHSALIKKNMLSLPMKAGEAIFFFHGLIHGSTHNHTDKSRVCLGLTLTPKDANLRYYYMDKSKSENTLEQFDTTPDFYINYAADRAFKPNIEGVSIQFNFSKLKEKDLYKKIKSVMGEDTKALDNNSSSSNINVNWWQKIKYSFLKS
jgi:hypothetical protein